MRDKLVSIGAPRLHPGLGTFVTAPVEQSYRFAHMHTFASVPASCGEVTVDTPGFLSHAALAGEGRRANGPVGRWPGSHMREQEVWWPRGRDSTATGFRCGERLSFAEQTDCAVRPLFDGTRFLFNC